MLRIFRKSGGAGAPLPPRPAARAVILAGFGGFVAIAMISRLTDLTAAPWILGSFGASCVLVFGYPEAAFSRPRNVVAGHLISSIVGLAFLTAFGPHWWSVAMSAGTAIAIMMFTRTVHPPAGSNPVIVFLTQPDWSFLLFPTLAGSLALVAVTHVYNHAIRTLK